jgi:hypothetical protein
MLAGQAGLAADLVAASEPVASAGLLLLMTDLAGQVQGSGVLG